jgi:asparagine synthase (glutamine-hydrolysing)
MFLRTYKDGRENSRSICNVCGIAGWSGPITDTDLLRRMCDIIKHRGPDDEGYYSDGDVALGVRRLSIIDLETGAQPIHNEDETVWLVFNGEIYNYIELRSNLESRHRFYTKSDTEVIVHLYEELGERCLSELNGMFAFALWDKKKRKLFLARDRIGVKPLYYSFKSGTFIFASEVKAVLAFGIEAKPDRRAIIDYVNLGSVLGDKTFFEGVQLLPAGHFAVFENGNLRVEQYWDLKWNIVQRSEKETEERLRVLLWDAVRIRLRSDVPVGCNLSGGIDSSVVTGIASKLLGGRVKTFTVAFHKGPWFDETRYSRIASEHARTEHHEIWPDGKDFLETLDRLIWFMDYPEVPDQLYQHYYVSRLARQYVKVILGGQGGDEIFGGYYWFIEAQLKHQIASEKHLAGKLSALLAYLRCVKQHGRYYQLLRESERVLDNLFKRSPSYHPYSSSDIAEWFYQDRSEFSEQELSEMFTEQFRAATSGYSTKDSFSKILNEVRSDSSLDKIQYYSLKTLLPALLHMQDRTSMAVSLESRVPFSDDRNLVEFVGTIAPSLRVRGSRLKHILREAAKDVLPVEVYDRRDKKGFAAPIRFWLREQSDAVRSILLSKEAEARRVFNREYVEKVIKEYESGNNSRLWTIFPMLCVELWFRNFIDKKGQEMQEKLPTYDGRSNLKKKVSGVGEPFGEAAQLL